MNRQIKAGCSISHQYGSAVRDSEIDSVPVVFGLYPNLCSFANGKLRTLSNSHALFGRNSCCSEMTVHSLFVVFKRVVQLSGKMVLDEAMAAAPLLVLVRMGSGIEA